MSVNINFIYQNTLQVIHFYVNSRTKNDFENNKHIIDI